MTEFYLWSFRTSMPSRVVRLRPAASWGLSFRRFHFLPSSGSAPTRLTAEPLPNLLEHTRPKVLLRPSA